MTNAILPVAGAIGGFIVGGPQGAMMGANLGMLANNFVLPVKKRTVKLPSQNGPRLSDLRVQLSSYGETIPKVYSSIRLSGNVIWATDIKETAHEHVDSSISEGGGKGGGRRQVTTEQSTITFTYSVSIAIAICEGPVDEVIRIWADSKLLTDDALGVDQGKFNIHLGTEEQLPDDIIGKYKQAGTYPAYRGLCYVVMEDFPLEEFGNRIPSFTFEVKRTVKFRPAVEEKIKDVVLIPGAGEFVYSDKVHDIQNGLLLKKDFKPYDKKYYVNMHNYSNKANMLVAIEQMAKTLPNLEWVAVVVTWFATSSKAGNCKIVPKVEYKSQSSIVSPSDWRVAGINRDKAEEVLRFDERTPTYGGIPSDDTVIAVCKHLKERGYKVMLYPMIFVDEIAPSPKPWRGRITAKNAKEIDTWFNKTKGYNDFIMHYANLVKGEIDAFIIGSEMVGLTGFTDNPSSYPAVDQFIKLAAKVKATLGSKTLITYAADWSEYHHTAGGWFNLDPLWASRDIDFIGIDAYFPLTEDLPHAQITEKIIRQGWGSGEGWDYYYNHDRTKKHYFAKESPNEPYKYAWKNVEYWWSNHHQNPDGRVTQWQPKMKPIWFTEFGFPSVDACSNQPNVFYDPTSTESMFPRNSSGRVNFPAQRNALNASIDYLQERNNKEGFEQLIPRKFVWTYDAWPFPFWPDFKSVWQDGILWATGHWINGKLGTSNLGAIVAEILQTVGLQETDYDVSRLTDDVSGYIISQHITAREAIEQLQAAYFFDAVESNGILKFVSRLQSKPACKIMEEELVPNNSGDIKATLEYTIAQELELPQKVSISYIDNMQNYDFIAVQAQRQIVNTKEQVSFSLPIVLTNHQANKIADITLYNAWQERISYSLTLPPKYAKLEPTDIICIVIKGIIHQIRIIKTDMQRTGLMKIAGVSFNASVYDFYSDTNYLTPKYELPKPPLANTILELIDAPPLPKDINQNQAILRLAVVADSSNWQGACVYKSLDNGYDYKLLKNIATQSIIGVVLDKLQSGPTEIFDQYNEIIVQLMQGNLYSVSELALLNGANAVLINDELIQFQNAELIGNKRYKLTKLLRGRQGTEWAIPSHTKGDRFIMLTSAIPGININNYLIGKPILYKPVTIGKTLAETQSLAFTYNARNLKPFAPVHAKAMNDAVGNIIISWIRRSRVDNGWRDNVEVPIGEDLEKYQIDIKKGKELIRTLESSTITVTYTKEQQKIDFRKFSKKLTATIYQLSNQVGRGYGTTVSLF